MSKVEIIQINNVTESYLAGEYESMEEAKKELMSQNAFGYYEPEEDTADAVLSRIGEVHGGYAKIVVL